MASELRKEAVNTSNAWTGKVAIPALLMKAYTLKYGMKWITFEEKDEAKKPLATKHTRS